MRNSFTLFILFAFKGYGAKIWEGGAKNLHRVELNWKLEMKCLH